MNFVTGASGTVKFTAAETVVLGKASGAAGSDVTTISIPAGSLVETVIANSTALGSTGSTVTAGRDITADLTRGSSDSLAVYATGDKLSVTAAEGKTVTYILPQAGEPVAASGSTVAWGGGIAVDENAKIDDETDYILTFTVAGADARGTGLVRGSDNKAKTVDITSGLLGVTTTTIELVITAKS